MAQIKKQKLPDGTPLPFPPKTLSVCMIVKNEEQSLAKCLKSVVSFADEIVVVDTGSTDRTIQIARGNGAKVITADWRNDFSYSRNISISNASSSWVLWLDADDIVTEGAAVALNKMKREIEEPVAAFGIKVKNVQPGGLGEEFLQVRLFPNDRRLKFEKKVHEQIAPSLTRLGYKILYLTDIEIHHTGYQDESIKRAKALRNRKILEEDMPNFPDDPNYLAAYGDTFAMNDEWEKAAEVYRSVMEIPNCRQKQSDIFDYMPVTIALSYKHLKRYEEAMEWVNKGLALQKDKIELLFLGAEIAYDFGDFDRSFSLYQQTINAPEKVLSTATDFTALKSKALVRCGNILLKMGKAAEARAMYERIRQGSVEFFDVPASIAETYMKEGDIKEALRFYSESILKYPGKDIRAYRGMIDISLKFGKFDDATGFCEKGLSFFPDDLFLWTTVKDLYRRRNEMDKYIAASGKVNTLSANSTE